MPEEQFIPFIPEKEPDRANDKVEYFTDSKGDWRWHRKAQNGNIISESGEGYENKDDMLYMAESLNPGIELKEIQWDTTEQDTRPENTGPLPPFVDVGPPNEDEKALTDPTDE